jgi:hypothetical protein
MCRTLRRLRPGDFESLSTADVIPVKIAAETGSSTGMPASPMSRWHRMPKTSASRAIRR